VLLALVTALVLAACGGSGSTTTTSSTANTEAEGEKIAIDADDDSLAATTHGENFWAFSLNGTLEEAKGLEKEGEGTERADEEVFAEECSVCHGATGHGRNGGPDLRTMPLAETQEGAETQVTNGGGGMPAFKGTLSEEEISNVAAYVVEDIVGGK
jgi:cytochrome c551